MAACLLSPGMKNQLVLQQIFLLFLLCFLTVKKRKTLIIYGIIKFRALSEALEYYVYNITLWVCSVLSNSLRAHGLQPVRLLCPCNSPGKNAGESCHFPLQGIFLTQGSNLHLLFGGEFFTTEPLGKVKGKSVSCSVVFDSLQAHGLYGSGLLWTPGFFVLGILQARILEWVAIPFCRRSSPTQRSKLCLLHCRQILYSLS